MAIFVSETIFCYNEVNYKVKFKSQLLFTKIKGIFLLKVL